MPSLMERPTDQGEDHAQAFAHHGLDLTEGRGGQLDGACPFCAADKFTVEAATGLWRCWVCSRTGNPLEFLRVLWKASDAATNGWGKKLAEDRRLLDQATVTAWGACRSVVDGAWMVPGYNTRAELVQLYRRVQVQGKDQSWSWRLLPTPGVWESGKAHALHMPTGDYDPKRQTWYVAEGPWDGMAFWEVARQARSNGAPLEVTGNPSHSVIADANVVAVPGCSVWRGEWTEAVRGKDVVLLYDNDHPRDCNGVVTMAGRDGVVRVCGKLAGAARSVSYLAWGGGGFDASLADGFDVRDALTRGM